MLRQFKFLLFNAHLLHDQDKTSNVPGMDDADEEVRHQRSLAAHKHEVTVEVVLKQQTGLDHPRHDDKLHKHVEQAH